MLIILVGIWLTFWLKNWCVPFILFVGSSGSALLNDFQVIFSPNDILLYLASDPDFWKSPVTSVPEENQ